MGGIQSLMVETGSETRWTFPGNTPKSSRSPVENWNNPPVTFGIRKKEKKKQETPLENASSISLP